MVKDKGGNENRDAISLIKELFYDCLFVWGEESREPRRNTGNVSN